MKRLIYVAAALILPACGGGGGGGGGGPSPLVVSSRSPTDGTLNAARTTVVYVGFSRAADPTTVIGTNFTLSAGGNPVTATVTYEPCNNTAKLVPSAPLAASTAHTVNLSSAITDTSGVPLAADTFTFTTGASADTTLPAFGGIMGTIPATTSMDLSWSAATDASTPIVYEVFVSTVANCFNFGSPTQTTAAGATSANVPSLTSNTTYYFVVRARDAVGNVTQNTAQTTQKTLTSFLQDVWGSIVGVRCAGCHTSGQGSLVMMMSSATQTYTNWVNVNAVCVGLPAGTKRVLPSNGAASFVYQKVSMNPPPCGSRMPFDGPPFLSAAQQQTIRDWIDEGALNN